MKNSRAVGYSAPCILIFLKPSRSRVLFARLVLTAEAPPSVSADPSIRYHALVFPIGNLSYLGDFCQFGIHEVSQAKAIQTSKNADLYQDNSFG